MLITVAECFCYNTFVCYINLINVLTVSLDKIDFLFLFKKKNIYIYIYIYLYTFIYFYLTDSILEQVYIVKLVYKQGISSNR